MIDTVDEETGLLEIRREEYQKDLDQQKSPAERNRLGQFATPNKLALEIARYVTRFVDEPVRFADPSVGTGSFFSAVRATFRSGEIESALGVELDPAFADVARNVWGRCGLDVVTGDFTRVLVEAQAGYRPNLILANPPMCVIITSPRAISNDFSGWSPGWPEFRSAVSLVYTCTSCCWPPRGWLLMASPHG